MGQLRHNSSIINITPHRMGQLFTSGRSIRITGSITGQQSRTCRSAHIRHVWVITRPVLRLMDAHLYPANAAASFDQSITAVAGINYVKYRWQHKVIRAVYEARCFCGSKLQLSSRYVCYMRIGNFGYRFTWEVTAKPLQHSMMKGHRRRDLTVNVPPSAKWAVNEYGHGRRMAAGMAAA